MLTCTCWVRTTPPETQFGLRYGAHSLDCPRYRQSLDPCDRYDDAQIRDQGERFAAHEAAPVGWNFV